MTYEEFVAEFSTRVVAVLTTIRSQLIDAGVAANRPVTITPVNEFEQDTVDLRYQVVASTGNGGGLRTITAYIELSDASRFGEPMEGRGYITLFAQTDQGQSVAHTYTPGAYEFYTLDGGITALREKLTQLESAIPQLVNAARQYLRVQ